MLLIQLPYFTINFSSCTILLVLYSLKFLKIFKILNAKNGFALHLKSNPICKQFRSKGFLISLMNFHFVVVYFISVHQWDSPSSGVPDVCDSSSVHGMNYRLACLLADTVGDFLEMTPSVVYLFLCWDFMDKQLNIMAWFYSLPSSSWQYLQ